MGIKKALVDFAKNKATSLLVDPLSSIADESIKDVVTTIGLFVARSIRGKFQRSITFQVGLEYGDNWMEEALYGILYEYNDIKKMAKLELGNKKGESDGTTMYCRLDDGIHNLRYRKWNIMLSIQSKAAGNGRPHYVRMYTVITYDMDPEFIKSFERDMVRHRNALLKILPDSPNLLAYKDYYESNSPFTYWIKCPVMAKRRLNTIYIPMEKKKMLVDSINQFFKSKEYYHKHGIPWNFKILLYGPPGTGKSSIVKMIASEWNRNLYEISGGKNGKYIPDSLSSCDSTEVNHPLYSISDIDKYPQLINEPEIDLNAADAKDEKMQWKQVFNNMINALDGITSGEGKVIVMTTNHIDKFSETFLRPGRIDLMMKIDYVCPEVFCQYVHDFYKTDIPSDIKLSRDNITIAEMQFDIVFMKLSLPEFLKKYTK